MAGISSKALAFGSPKNKKGYNGNELQSGEFNDGSGLEFFDFNARSYDQQIGRFMQIDPLSDTVDQRSLAPFQFGYNNPVRYNDPSGKCPCLFLIPLAKAVIAAVGAAIVVKTAEPLIDEVIKSVEDRRLDGKDNSSSSNSDKTAPKKQDDLDIDPDAGGDHVSLKRDNAGNVYQYQEWWKNPFNPNGYDKGDRFDGGKSDGSKGKPHFDKKTGKNVETPHINEKSGGVKAPTKQETPNNKRFWEFWK